MHVTPNEDTRGLLATANDGDYMTIGDYNDDGYLDILARKSGAVLENDLYSNDGDNTFTVDAIFEGQADNGNKGGVAFCDFDNDGDFDIIWTSNDDREAVSGLMKILFGCKQVFIRGIL